MPDPLSVHQLADDWARESHVRLTGSNTITPETSELYRAAYDYYSDRLAFHSWATPSNELADPAAFARHAEGVVREMCDRVASHFGFPHSSDLVDRIVFDASREYAEESYARFGMAEPEHSSGVLVRELRFGRYFLYGNRAAMHRAAEQGIDHAWQDAHSEVAGQMLAVLHELEHASAYRVHFEAAISEGQSPLDADRIAWDRMGGTNERYALEEVRAESGALKRLLAMMVGVDRELVQSSATYLDAYGGLLGGNAYRSSLSSQRTHAAQGTAEERLRGGFDFELERGRAFGGLIVGAPLDASVVVPQSMRLIPTGDRTRACLEVDVGEGTERRAIRTACFPNSVIRAAIRIIWPSVAGLPDWLLGSESGLATGSPDGYAVHPAIEEGLPAMAAQSLEEYPLVWNAGGSACPGMSDGSFGKRGSSLTWDVGRLLFAERPQLIQCVSAQLRAMPAAGEYFRLRPLINTMDRHEASRQFASELDGISCRIISELEGAALGTADGPVNNKWRDLDYSEARAIHSSFAAFVWEQLLEAIAICRWMRAHAVLPDAIFTESVMALPVAPLGWQWPGSLYAPQTRSTGIGAAIRDACNTIAAGGDALACLFITRRGEMKSARLVLRKKSQNPAWTSRVSRLLRLEFQSVDGDIRWLPAEPVYWSSRTFEREATASPQVTGGFRLWWENRVSALKHWFWCVMTRRWEWRRCSDVEDRYEISTPLGKERKASRLHWGQPLATDASEVLRIKPGMSVSEQNQWDLTIQALDDPLSWKRASGSSIRVPVIQSSQLPRGLPNILLTCEPCDAERITSQTCDLSVLGDWTLPSALPAVLRRELLAWIGPAVVSHLRCPLSLCRVVERRIRVPFDTTKQHALSRPESFCTSDIRGAMVLGGECTSQAVITAALGLLLGHEARTCNGALLTEAPHRGAATMGLHMWAELRFRDAVTICDHSGHSRPRFYKSVQRLGRPVRYLVPPSLRGTYVAVIGTAAFEPTHVKDHEWRLGQCIDMHASSARLAVLDDATLLTHLLEVLSRCTCQVCLREGDRRIRMAEVIAGLVARGLLVETVDRELKAMMRPDPFAMVVADRLARAVQESQGTPLTAWIGAQERAAAIGSATRFRERIAPTVAAVRRELENFQPSEIVLRILRA